MALVLKNLFAWDGKCIPLANALMMIMTVYSTFGQNGLLFVDNNFFTFLLVVH